MYLPDKIIIDLKQVDLIVNKIASLLKKIIKFTKCGQVVDVGNDLDYSLKEITSFKKKLIDLITDESKKYQSDIFGNTIKSINNYRYVEIMFSENYKEITSIRLVGKNKRGSYSRYALFNMENIFDPTVINLLYNADDIIQSKNAILENETKYIDFLKEYFAPFPVLHPIKEKDIKCLDNISKKFDDGKEKNLDELIKQTNKFGSIDFKMPIFDIREPSFSQIGSLSFIIPEIDDLLKKIDIAEIDGDPKKLIDIVQTNLLDKYKIPDITGFVFDGLNLNLDPFKFLSDLPPADMFAKIDDLPKDVRDKIYKFLRDPFGPINLDKILIDLQEFVNFKLNLGNIDLNLSILLNKLFADLESIKIPQMLINFVELRVPDANLTNPNFKFQNPDILSKINKFDTTFDGWILKINGILNIFNTNPLLMNIPEAGQIKGQFIELNNKLGGLKLKFPELKKLDLNFNIILQGMYDSLKGIALPEILFNLDQFINKKAKKTKCNVKLSKVKKNIKLTDLFKKIKLKFPNLFTDFQARFNLIFPKFDLLEQLKNLIDFDIFNFKIPEFDIPKFKLPNFEFDINDLFGDFSKQIDLSILSGLSNILSEITKNLLELLNSLNKLDDFAFENMFPLPQLSIPNPNIPKFQAAFNEEWLIYIEYVYKLLLETDKQRTEPQIVKLPSKFINSPAIKNKIISRKRMVPEELCENLEPIKSVKINKNTLKKKKIDNVQDAVDALDVESLMEKIKYYDFSDTHDYFQTENSNDDLSVDVMRFISKSLKSSSPQTRPKLPLSSAEIIKSTSDMVEQIESILDQQEMNSLLNGSYTEETAEIVRNIAKINFPTLTYRVDPIKYFRMLGKVIGSKNTPKILSPQNALRNLGVKK